MPGLYIYIYRERERERKREGRWGKVTEALVARVGQSLCTIVLVPVYFCTHMSQLANRYNLEI